MSEVNEPWFIKIISLPNELPRIFKCKKTKIEMPFQIDENKILEYRNTQVPKWIDGEKYHLISRRSWGLGKNICLYVDHFGENYVIESTY